MVASRQALWSSAVHAPSSWPAMVEQQVQGVKKTTMIARPLADCDSPALLLPLPAPLLPVPVELQGCQAHIEGNCDSQLH